MERFALVTKEDALSKVLFEKIKQALSEVMIYDEKTPELVISIGGDGTMLDACHRYMHQIDQTYFVGLHTGTLGFYTDYDHTLWKQLVEDIKNGQGRLDRRSLLEIRNGQQVAYALNEFRLEENHRTMVCDVYLNQEFLECFRGNGLCVSTPSGSTAYNRSLSGSIVASSLKSMQLAEIAGIHHNAYRSLQSALVLDHTTTLTFKPQGGWQTIMGIDREVYPVHDGDVIEVKVAPMCMTFIHFRKVSLCSRLRRAFISE